MTTEDDLLAGGVLSEDGDYGRGQPPRRLPKSAAQRAFAVSRRMLDVGDVLAERAEAKPRMVSDGVPVFSMDVGFASSAKRRDRRP